MIEMSKKFHFQSEEHDIIMEKWVRSSAVVDMELWVQTSNSHHFTFLHKICVKKYKDRKKRGWVFKGNIRFEICWVHKK